MIMKRMLFAALLVVSPLLMTPSVHAAAPSWCRLVSLHGYWVEERMTQRGPWSSLTKAQKRYYRGVEKKADDARLAALRAIYRDRSSVGRSLTRDLALLDTFTFDIPVNERQEFVDAKIRVRQNIRGVCGIE